MNADTLRIVLLILGVLLVAGIYFWDRYKQHLPGPGSGRFRRDRVQPEIATDTARVEDRAEPTFDIGKPLVTDAIPETEPAESVSPDSEPVVESTDSGLSSTAEEELDVTGDWQLPLDDEPEVSSQISLSAHDETDYLHQVEGIDDGLPKLVLQINVSARSGEFDGERLAGAFEATGLSPGELEIFHRFDLQRPDMVVFSAANQLEPGSFPVKAMTSFSTPGITLFTQLPGIKDGVAIYKDMVSTAEQLAVLLNAELQDESRSTLSKQCIERTKDSVLEFQRELALARRRA